MSVLDRGNQLERHALVMAVWLPVGLMIIVLLHFGLGAGGPVWVFASAGMAIIGFLGHVIVNAVLKTEFSPREVALGLVIYGAAILAVVLCALTIDGFTARYFLPAVAGLAAIALVVVFYMITYYGVRRAFENFDVIREFNPRPASFLRRRRLLRRPSR